MLGGGRGALIASAGVGKGGDWAKCGGRAGDAGWAVLEYWGAVARRRGGPDRLGEGKARVGHSDGGRAGGDAGGPGCSAGRGALTASARLAPVRLAPDRSAPLRSALSCRGPLALALALPPSLHLSLPLPISPHPSLSLSISLSLNLSVSLSLSLPLSRSPPTCYFSHFLSLVMLSLNFWHLMPKKR